MQGGWIKDYRKELNSEIWQLPPLYHRVWQWLKYQANHEETTIPMADGGSLGIKRGQHLTSIRNIAHGVGWFEGALWKEPNPKTISKIIQWLEKKRMITIDRGRGNRQYTLISIVKYEDYQGFVHDGVTANGEGSGYKQEGSKNDKEKNIYIDFCKIDGDTFFEIYNEIHREQFHRDHPPIKEQQIQWAFSLFKQIRERGYDELDFREKAEEHFFLLPESNDGKMQSFLTAIDRYFPK